MLIFEKIRWLNFLSTGNVFTEINLNSSKHTLIVGANGAGKSTILDAIAFVLYNKPFRNINKPQLINSINQKGMVVEIEFSIGNDNYCVRRGMKPSIFEIIKNGDLINQSADARDYQEYLEKNILKLNFKSFSQIVVLGSASFVPFMQLTAANRRSVIEDLLDIQIFSVMNTLLKSKIQENKNLITNLDYQRNIANEKIKLQKQHISQLKQDKQQLIVAANNQINECTTLITTYSNELKEKETKKLQLNLLTDDYSKLVKRIDSLSRLEAQLQQKLQRIKKEIDFFVSNTNCPTCKQEISKSFACEAIEIRSSEESEIKDGMNKLEVDYKLTQSKKYEIDNIIKQIDVIDGDIIKINSNIQLQKNLITRYNNEMKKYTDQQTEMEETNTQLQELEQQLKEAEEQKETLSKDKNVLDVAETLLKDSGIKSKIIKQYTPIINKLINKYLAAMDFFVNFELDENFNETIKSRFRDEFSYESFSEGEKMRLNLAILFAWRAVSKLRNSASTNLLILDEIMDGSLDSAGIDDFLKIIFNLTNDTNTFIISHKQDQMIDKFSNILRFEKHKNFSVIR